MKKAFVNNQFNKLNEEFTLCDKNSNLYNEIRKILRTLGYDKFNEEYIVRFRFDNKLSNKIKNFVTIEMIYELYSFENDIKYVFLKHIMAIENMLSLQLKNIGKEPRTFQEKIKCFKVLDIEEKEKIIKSIDSKLTLNDYSLGLEVARQLRNTICHNKTILTRIQVKSEDNYLIVPGNKQFVSLYESIGILHKLSEEKYLSDTFHANYKNMLGKFKDNKAKLIASIINKLK